jgi:hypothetical protein
MTWRGVAGGALAVRVGSAAPMAGPKRRFHRTTPIWQVAVHAAME